MKNNKKNNNVKKDYMTKEEIEFYKLLNRIAKNKEQV